VSPSRTRRPVAKVRPRSEIVKAVGGAAAVVLATALLVWLIRPRGKDVSDRGGLLTRQPRMAWLVVLGIIAAAFVVRWVLRNRRTRSRRKVLIPIVLIVVLVFTTIAGFAWPGGVIHHYPAAAKAPTNTTPATSPPGTGSGSTTPATATGATGTSPAPATGETSPPTTGSP
jgi:cytochrome bd-type quinol oxidase subunit 2